MKKLHILLLVLVCSTGLYAQSPDKMSYQAILRDAGDALLVNQGVGIQVSILSASCGGTAVYVETHSATTNVNGLVSLEIGTGSIVSGTFSGIDWSGDSYYLKTETDPTTSGGTSYTITGCTQLLSVPYALHAKTASNGLPSGGTEGQVLQMIGGVATWVTPGTCSDGVMNQDETGVDCGGTCEECPAVAVGDCLADGVVFYIFQPSDAGYVVGEIHGLIVSLDEGQGNWGCYGTNLPAVPDVITGVADPETVAGARIGDGTTNTDGIISGCPTGYAADWCRAKGPEWFLPSRGELNELYKWYDTDKTGNNTLIVNCGGGGFAAAYYWSSTEVANFVAWGQDFSSGFQSISNKSLNVHVRAVRAF